MHTSRELVNANHKDQVCRSTFYTFPSCLVEKVENRSGGQTEKIKHSAYFFLMNWNLHSRHSKSFNHRSATCFSMCNLLLLLPYSTAMWAMFEIMSFHILKIFLKPFPHFHLVSSSFKSCYKCYLLFAALLIHPSELLAPQNISPPRARSRLALCTTHSTLNKRSYDFTTSLATGQGVGLFWEERKCDSPA